MKFKSNIETQAGIEDSAASAGTAGQLLSSLGNVAGADGVEWVDQSTIIAAAATLVEIECKNTSGSTITKGTPVYQTGNVGATAVIEIAEADALISANQGPAIGLLQDTLINNAVGFVVIIGELLNLQTSPIDGLVPTVGDKIFVKSGGGLTTVKPTTSLNNIQAVGLVGKVSAGNAGSVTVSSTMRANDVPNLPEGRIWIGDGNTIVSDTVYVDEPNNRVGVNKIDPDYDLDVNGAIRASEGFITGPENDTVRILSPNNATFSTAFGASPTGAIKIEIPPDLLEGTSSTVVNVSFKIAVNAGLTSIGATGGNSFVLQFNGAWQRGNTGVGAWGLIDGCTISGNPRANLNYDITYYSAANSASDIWIATPTTSWGNTGTTVSVTDLQLSGDTSGGDVNASWAISLDTSALPTVGVGTLGNLQVTNWKRSGDDITYTDGNVGIGGGADVKLHLVGSNTTMSTPGGSLGSVLRLDNRWFQGSNPVNGGEVQFGFPGQDVVAGDDANRIRVAAIKGLLSETGANDTFGGSLSFYTQSVDSGSTLNKSMTINHDSAVSINTDNADDILNVKGSAKIGGDFTVSDGLGGADRTLSITANAGLFKIGDIDGVGDEAYIEGDSANIKIFTGGGEAFVCDINQRSEFKGNVGINSTPSSTFDLKIGQLNSTTTTAVNRSIVVNAIAGNASSATAGLYLATSQTQGEARIGMGYTQFVDNNTAGLIKYTSADDKMLFRTAFSDVMNLNNSRVFVNKRININSTIATAPTYGYNPTGYNNTPGEIVIGGYQSSTQFPGVATFIKMDTSINTGDELGVIQFVGKDDATSGYCSSQIIGSVLSASGQGSNNKGKLDFKTSNTGGGQVPLSQLSISSTDVLIPNANVGINDGTPSYKLDVNGEGRFTGDLRCLSLIQTSQSDKKESIHNIVKTSGKKIEFKEYVYKSDSGNRKRYGVLAEDIEVEYPELVHVDADGVKGVNYIDLLVKRVSELEKEIEDIAPRSMFLNWRGYHSSTSNGVLYDTGWSTNVEYPYATIIAPFKGNVSKISVTNNPYSSYKSGPTGNSATLRVIVNGSFEDAQVVSYTAGTPGDLITFDFGQDIEIEANDRIQLQFQANGFWRYMNVGIQLRETI
tara:strand:+ start:3096 stop:6455 length:3360 start_codon:yes stop_codon:yes gene_type:complete